MAAPRARIELAKKRVESVLRVRLYCNTRQLESKIAESGPTSSDHNQSSQRCDPHIIRQAVKELQDEGKLQQEGQFYFLTESTKTALKGAKLAARKRLIIPAHETYLKLTSGNNAACGAVLEEAIESAIRNCPQYRQIGNRKRQVQIFGDVQLPGPLDALCILSTVDACVLAGFEAKNVREWFYPNAKEVWLLIHKLNLLSGSGIKPLPILVCRKIPYYARRAFKALGMLGFETHRQMFDPAVKGELTVVRDKDLLGFHDVCTELEPYPHIEKFIRQTVPQNAKTYSERFFANKSLFDEFALPLSSRTTSNADRHALWQRVKEHLGIYKYMDEHE